MGAKISKKAALGIGAAAVVVAGGAAAAVMMTAKDPKETVIQAFETIWEEGQTLPSEEIFGWEELAQAMNTGDSEGGLTITLDSSTSPQVDAYAGAGLRLKGRNDVTNGKTDLNMGLIYGGMDLVNVDAYYGEDTLLVAVPELTGKVFSLELGEGLADRFKASPVLGPMLEQSGIDADGMAEYFNQLKALAESSDPNAGSVDFKGLFERYR